MSSDTSVVQSPNCIFCKIVDKAIPANVVYEDDEFIAFHDINPAAPIHVLLIPKQHIATLADSTPEHRDLLGRMMLLAPQVARMAGAPDLPQGGFRVLMNVGPQGGQEVYHIHLHILAGPQPWRGFAQGQ